jgi:hypothetical protein
VSFASDRGELLKVEDRQFVGLGARPGVSGRPTAHAGASTSYCPDRRLRVSAVINCTGPSADVRRSRDPLVRRLLDSRVGHPGPLFLGFGTDDRGCMRDANDALWVVGPLRRGQRCESTAIPDIRMQAADLSRSLQRADTVVGA